MKNNIKTTFQREIVGKAENKAKFYLVLTGAAVILFVIFGIRPLAKTAAQNRNVYVELKRITLLQSQKLTKIKSEMDKVNALGDQLGLLYKKIPTDPMLESYLEEVVYVSARSGFAIQRFRQMESYNEGIPLEIDLLGTQDNIPKLISGLEETSRFSNIVSIRTGLEDNVTSVRLVILVYNL